MGSEEVCPDYFEKLDCPPDFAKEADILLPKLLIDIENNALGLHFERIVKTLFGPLFKSFEIENVEVKMLKMLLPCLGRVFSFSLTSIAETVKNSNENTDGEGIKTTVLNFSQNCLHILSAYNDLLCHLSTYETIKICWIISLPKSINDILAATFIHCRDSETIYHSLFTTFSDFLTTFFRQGYEVQANFFKLLENVLEFNCSFEDELSLLVEVLETMVQIGEIVVKLDSKTLADQWKTYVKLAHKYAAFLRPRLDIARPIICLSEILQQTVGMLCKQVSIEQNTQSRNIKVGSFILKIIIKFCEQYEGYLGDCYDKILELLITLNGVMYLREKGVISGLIQHITVGAGPLLRHVLGEMQFVQKFSDRCDSLKTLTSEAKVGLFLLLLNILKKLSTVESEIKEFWWRIPLIENILNISKACLYEMKNLTVDGTTAYTCLVSRTASVLISNGKKSNFLKAEKVLISCLLQPDLYKAMFTQDLLCLLARLMSGEVCAKQVIYLSGLMVNWPNKCYTRPEFKYVGTTVSRLFPLLSLKSKIYICHKYHPHENPILWSYLGLHHLDSSCFDEKQYIEDITKCLHTNSAIDSLESYQQLIKILEVLPACILIEKGKKGASDFSDILKGMSKLWNSLDNSLHNCNHWSLTKLPDWWSRLFNCTCKVTCGIILEMNSSEHLEVLKVMLLAIRACDSSCKVSLMSVLKVMGDCDFKGTYVQDLCSRICHLFSTLLSENNPLVKQNALDSFSYFARVTTHEKIVAATVNNNSLLQNNLASYLRCQQTAQVPQGNVSDLLYYSDDTFIHSCYNPVSYTSETHRTNYELNMRPTKKLKTNAGEKEIEIAEQILKDLMNLNAINITVESEHLKQVCVKISGQLDILMQKLCSPEK